MERSDGDIFRFYQVANSLHDFYENEFTPEDVAQALSDVEAVLTRWIRWLAGVGYIMDVGRTKP